MEMTAQGIVVHPRLLVNSQMKKRNVVDRPVESVTPPVGNVYATLHTEVMRANLPVLWESLFILI